MTTGNNSSIIIPKDIKGLTERESSEAIRLHGTNEIIVQKKISILFSILEKLKNPLILILIVVTIISIFFRNVVEALLILSMISVSISLDVFNSYKSDQAARLLKEKVRINSLVVRGQKTKLIPRELIAPGDVVFLSPGDLVPADGTICHAKDFFLNESALTGESYPREILDDGEVMMGSSVVTGEAFLKVKTTGKSTKYGTITKSLMSATASTDFDRGIRDFSKMTMWVIITIVIVVFIINTANGRSLLESFLFAAALAVGLTPELLPVIITVNLSKGSLRMAKQGVIVKKLSSIQNLGGMDVLCTDKTGTLTEDRIELVKYVDATGSESDAVLFSAYLSSYHQTARKNPLNSAILKGRNLDISKYNKADEVPFDYSRRRDTVIVEQSGKHLMISKGATEELLTVCEFIENTGKPLSPDSRIKINDLYKSLSSDGFRVLAIATKEISNPKKTYEGSDETNMVFQGFVAFFDPPKKTVTETLRYLKEHGVEIKILTGDNELVTKKVASEINLKVEGVLTGPEIELMSDEELALHVKKTNIFARVLPAQKQRIIMCLKSHGHVVGFLGDGINDAPSLRAADVGISVDNAVDVAKETADLILMKKGLSELMSGIIEGRKTFTNTLKYLMMDLSSNFGNMFSMAGASLFVPFLPMLPAQVLLNNVLYDISQFALPFDNVDPEDIKYPRKWNIGMIRRYMLVFGPISSVFDFVTFYILLNVLQLGASGFQTGWFLESLATQTLVVHIIRTKKIPFIESRPSAILVFSTLATLGAGFIISTTKIGALMGFTPLSIQAIFGIALIAAIYLMTTNVTKILFFKYFGSYLKDSPRD